MAFGTAYLADPAAVGGGERQGSSHVIFAASVFEDNLKIGRFAKLDTGSIDNMDGSATPQIAGVVLRNIAGPVEDGALIDAQLYETIDYVRGGLVTVNVKTGETPSVLGKVYASNAGDANDGLATATGTDVPTNAEFIAEVQTGVWLIYVTPAPGDVATHIGDAVGAHAASAISLLDAGGFTAQIEVEAALAEIYPHIPVAVADPGDAGAIPVTRAATVALTTGAAGETRTLAIPTFVGQPIVISHDVDGGGDAVITVAAAFNQTGNNTITMADAGDTVKLEGVQVGGALVWRLIVNDGAALSTV
jgi:hypothetical protein